MDQNLYAVGAALALTLHLAWLLFVIFGALITRGRAVLTGLHWAALVWGFAVEAGPWPCPLTQLEQRLQAKAGLTPYRGDFVVYYLDRLVYPDIPSWVLVWGAGAVCALNVWIYVRRYRRSRDESAARL